MFDAATAAANAGNHAAAVDLYTQLESRVARNARSLAILRVRKAMELNDLSRFYEARSLLQLAAPGLPQDDPTLANDRMEAAFALYLAGAQQDFAATGLTAQQCSIVDAKPSLRSAPTSAADYPTDLVSIGVEGWTVMEFDIAANGSTLNQRPVITYPPMTFGPNGEKIVRRAKFEQSYRPQGELGCGGGTTRISFVKPAG